MEQEAFDYSEQQKHLHRVRGNIAPLIVKFCEEALKTSAGLFTAADLRAYVERNTQSAPASADRILRQLRDEGTIRYEVMNRRQSLYQVTAVKTLKGATQ